MILRDFACPVHGVFESADTTPPCPQGCSPRLVKTAFLKAPGFRSEATKRMDRNLRSLAKDFNLTDMNNHNGTTAAVTPDWKATQAQAAMQQQLLSGQTYAAPLADGGVPQTLQALGSTADNAVERARSLLPPPKPIVAGRFTPEKLPPV